MSTSNKMIYLRSELWREENSEGNIPHQFEFQCFAAVTAVDDLN